jgi:hypothetical protein
MATINQSNLLFPLAAGKCWMRPLPPSLGWSSIRSEAVVSSAHQTACFHSGLCLCFFLVFVSVRYRLAGLEQLESGTIGKA